MLQTPLMRTRTRIIQIHQRRICTIYMIIVNIPGDVIKSELDLIRNESCFAKIKSKIQTWCDFSNWNVKAEELSRLMLIFYFNCFFKDWFATIYTNANFSKERGKFEYIYLIKIELKRSSLWTGNETRRKMQWATISRQAKKLE